MDVDDLGVSGSCCILCINLVRIFFFLLFLDGSKGFYTIMYDL